MNKYVKNGKIINATEKAYNVVYKEQGFIPYVAEKKCVEEKKEEVSVSKMKKDELLAYVAEKGIELPEDVTTVDAIRKYIKELEEKKEEADK